MASISQIFDRSFDSSCTSRVLPDDYVDSTAITPTYMMDVILMASTSRIANGNGGIKTATDERTDLLTI